ncbi:hypothetical protein HK101_006806 [Irineochytrium annulatum]|nr:hypothetical protein HK101_006806 [Irineochytrium annulatum]
MGKGASKNVRIPTPPQPVQPAPMRPPTQPRPPPAEAFDPKMENVHAISNFNKIGFGVTSRPVDEPLKTNGMLNVIAQRDRAAAQHQQSKRLSAVQLHELLVRRRMGSDAFPADGTPADIARILRNLNAPERRGGADPNGMQQAIWVDDLRALRAAEKS